MGVEVSPLHALRFKPLSSLKTAQDLSRALAYPGIMRAVGAESLLQHSSRREPVNRYHDCVLLSCFQCPWLATGCSQTRSRTPSKVMETCSSQNKGTLKSYW
ncbi:hypothetical protein MTO96_015679 [Rhipicephalus appendiculatus]